MHDFLKALSDSSIPFFRYAFIAGIMGSVAFGTIGTYVVTRRITYIAGAISHCVLGGIGAALFIQKRFDIAWSQPIYGAIIAALCSAVIIGLVSLKAKEREDTVIGALWALGMGIGIIFIAKTPGYADPMSYLFGNILLITRQDLFVIAVLDIIIIASAVIFYNKFLAVCFDERFAKLRGMRTEFYYLLILCLTALTIVLMVTIVGIVMVIALLTLPAAAAGQFTRKLSAMMVLATLFSVFFTSAGLALSYDLDLPSGPVIILFAGACYIICVSLRHFLSKSSAG